MPINNNDPRYYQIGTLSLLLLYGIYYLDFDIRVIVAAIIIFSTQLTQFVLTRLKQLPSFDPRSPLITSLSLCLLLRTESLLIAALAAFLAISSKFFIRWKNKHIFNPANLALVILSLSFDAAWISQGQWGHYVYFAFLTACFGSLVLYRSRRMDITLAFLLFYTLLIFGRAIWLGDPFSIPAHQLQSGALLIFAFFMISDPKTTPDSRTGRLIFAGAVVLITGYIQFILYQPNAILYALIIACPLTPFIDKLIPDEKFQWRT